MTLDFDHRKSTRSWAKVDYDRDRWIPVPLTFEGTKWPDAARWALHYAEDRARRTYGELTRKVMRNEVEPRAASFLDVHGDMVGKIPAHKFFINFPDCDTVPLPVGIGLWAPQGTREDAFAYYSWWSAHDPQDAFSEWFETESLGTGVKARWRAVENGKPIWAVNYVFRDEEWQTDVHVFTSWPDQQRFEEVLADLDVLVRAVSGCPRPSARA